MSENQDDKPAEATGTTPPAFASLSDERKVELFALIGVKLKEWGEALDGYYKGERTLENVRASVSSMVGTMLESALGHDNLERGTMPRNNEQVSADFSAVTVAAAGLIHDEAAAAEERAEEFRGPVIDHIDTLTAEVVDAGIFVADPPQANAPEVSESTARARAARTLDPIRTLQQRHKAQRLVFVKAVRKLVVELMVKYERVLPGPMFDGRGRLTADRLSSAFSDL